jgi:putative transposase
VALVRGFRRSSTWLSSRPNPEIGLFNTELIHHRGPWRGLDDVELATLEWVDWHNHHRRLHSACHDLTPAEYELIHHGQHPALTEAGVSTT